MIIWGGELYHNCFKWIHAYSSRSAAPNSLSIWTHNIKGLEFFDANKFTPKHCSVPIDKHVITVGAGTQILEVDEQASLRNLTVVGGGSGSVGIGGYLTGGGHSAISLTFGLAADQVVEMEVVTPSGNIVTANACQNKDLFWAMRGVSSSIPFNGKRPVLNNDHRVAAQLLASSSQQLSWPTPPSSLLPSRPCSVPQFPLATPTTRLLPPSTRSHQT